jgi:hypothetical protein
MWEVQPTSRFAPRLSFPVQSTADMAPHEAVIETGLT